MYLTSFTFDLNTEFTKNRQKYEIPVDSANQLKAYILILEMTNADC